MLPAMMTKYLFGRLIIFKLSGYATCPLSDKTIPRYFEEIANMFFGRRIGLKMLAIKAMLGLFATMKHKQQTPLTIRWRRKPHTPRNRRTTLDIGARGTRT